jgi:hypothetical protein
MSASRILKPTLLAKLGIISKLDTFERVLNTLVGVICSTLLTFISVVFCWAAIDEQWPSSLSNLQRGVSAWKPIGTFLWAMLILQAIFIGWTLYTAKISGSHVKESRKASRGNRISITTKWSAICSIMALGAFWFCWIQYQQPQPLRTQIGVDPLALLQVVGTMLLVFSGLTWSQRLLSKWIAKNWGMSLAPVVGVRSDMRLQLADGHCLVFREPNEWPKKGIGRSKIAFVIHPGDFPQSTQYSRDVVVTENGDAFFGD